MRLTFFILSVLLLASCSNNNTITLSGVITNPDSNVITLNIPYTQTHDTIATLAEDGTFKATIEISKPHMANLINGDAYLKLNLVPGANLNIKFDGIELKSGKAANVTITGEGSESSSLLLNMRNADTNNNLRAVLSLPTAEFEETVTSDAMLLSKMIEEFESSNPGNDTFIEMLRLEQKVLLAQKYDYFVMYHARFAPNDTLPIPEEYKTFSATIPTDNYEAFKEIRVYQQFVVNEHTSKIENQIKEEEIEERSAEFVNREIDIIKTLEVPQIVKDELGNRLLGSYTYQPDSIKNIMKERYTEIITNKKYTKAFTVLLAQLEKLQPGAIAPTFAYNDINGEKVTSEDLKGKVIYIDVWATWCGPCKAEIPHLKKMEEELHEQDIAFVSISVDNNKSAWEKMVAEKELKGYQLFAPNDWNSEIIKDYAIRGIPRFIMIDKEGKLVNANASRPSNPETKEKLIELANS
ncbi:TlpA family protein disulfide reductase [Carboxylicivirga linearis]|uniref:TlpA family protein disulfide reductase n=1 Tax=Carboxylicivirga linearis TaxID=1628157 RepID=A0ABS5JS03_9BACT|nr:TlpA disulfide reductase family protein [Carboxylicivirga linearis]MBS2097683.1 TlpA family protein disulfide reductase [Carboxylicivirga linearis]